MILFSNFSSRNNTVISQLYLPEFIVLELVWVLNSIQFNATWNAIHEPDLISMAMGIWEREIQRGKKEKKNQKAVKISSHKMLRTLTTCTL